MSSAGQGLFSAGGSGSAALALKCGKCVFAEKTKEDGTKCLVVTPTAAEKGELSIAQAGADGVVHLKWTHRETGAVEPGNPKKSSAPPSASASLTGANGAEPLSRPNLPGHAAAQRHERPQPVGRRVLEAHLRGRGEVARDEMARRLPGGWGGVAAHPERPPRLSHAGADELALLVEV